MKRKGILFLCTAAVLCILSVIAASAYSAVQQIQAEIPNKYTLTFDVSGGSILVSGSEESMEIQGHGSFTAEENEQVTITVPENFAVESCRIGGRDYTEKFSGGILTLPPVTQDFTAAIQLKPKTVQTDTEESSLPQTNAENSVISTAPANSENAQTAFGSYVSTGQTKNTVLFLLVLSAVTAGAVLLKRACNHKK